MSYRFIDYNAMSVKPGNTDVIAIFDVPGNELKKMTYATLKSFFVKTDEATDISTSHKILTNYNLYFGNSAEARLIFDGTNFILGTTAVASTAKLKLRCNAMDFLTLDPVNASAAFGTKALNNDGAAGEGMNFDSSNRPVLLSILQMNAGIATKLKQISYNGAAATGLSFDVSNNGTFAQDLNITGQLNANKTGSYALQTASGGISNFRGNLRTNLNYISNDGTNTGFYVNASNQLTAVTQINAAYAGSYSLQAEGPCYFKGNLRIVTNYISHDGTNAGLCFDSGNDATFSGNVFATSGYVEAGMLTGDNSIGTGPSGYITAGSYIRTSTYLQLKDGVTAPGTVATFGSIYIDTADGSLKVKFASGTIKTLATDP